VDGYEATFVAGTLIAGATATMGLDPGFRTGVKVAVVDGTGKAVATSVIYPHEPRRRWDEALAILGKLE
jgi:protein Tex